MSRMNRSQITREELRKMREVDIRTVDPSTLVDVKDVKINTDLPKEERILDYIQQIKNPYCYLYNGMIVKVSFTGERRLEDCLLDTLSLEYPVNYEPKKEEREKVIPFFSPDAA